MMLNKVWFENNLMHFEREYAFGIFSPYNDAPDIPPPPNFVDLQVGNVEKFEQHGYTLYVKGSERNVIVVEIGKMDMRVLHEYSHLIPTWMKEDFNRFLKENE